MQSLRQPMPVIIRPKNKIASFKACSFIYTLIILMIEEDICKGVSNEKEKDRF